MPDQDKNNSNLPAQPEVGFPEAKAPPESHISINYGRLSQLVVDFLNSIESHLQAAPLFKEPDTEDFFKRFDKRKILKGLWQHFTLIIKCGLALFLLGLITTYSFMTTYQAEAVLIYNAVNVQNLPGGTAVAAINMATAVDSIKIPSNLEAVKKSLNLDIDPKVLGAMIYIVPPRTDSNLIRINSISRDPELNVKIVNALAAAAAKNSQEFTQAQYESAFLIDQLATTQNKLREAALHASTARAEYENIKLQISSAPEHVQVSVLSKDSPLQSRIAILEAMLAEARAKYSKENPKLKQLEKELNDLKEQLQQSVAGKGPASSFERNPARATLENELIMAETKMRAAEKTRDDLATTVSILQKGLNTIPTGQDSFYQLMQSKQLSEDQRKLFMDILLSAQLLMPMASSSLEVYQYATESKRYKESTTIITFPIMMLMFGLGIGAIIAAFREMYDPKLRTAKQIDLAYYLPCTLVIPEIPSLTPANASEKTLYFVRTLAERIEQLIKERSLVPGQAIYGCLGITFLSSVSGEGKSCLAYNLAHYFSFLGKKVILLEFDYNKNPLSDPLPTSIEPIERYLNGEVPLEEIIYHGNPDRIVMMHPEPHMKELIKSQAMINLWDVLKDEYDIIIIDSPGIIEEHYAINLAAISNMTFMVVGSSQVDKAVVDESLRELDAVGIRPQGIILNRVEPIYVDDKRYKVAANKGYWSLMGTAYKDIHDDALVVVKYIKKGYSWVVSHLFKTKNG